MFTTPHVAIMYKKLKPKLDIMSNYKHIITNLSIFVCTYIAFSKTYAVNQESYFWNYLKRMNDYYSYIFFPNWIKVSYRCETFIVLSPLGLLLVTLKLILYLNTARTIPICTRNCFNYCDFKWIQRRTWKELFIERSRKFNASYPKYLFETSFNFMCKSSTYWSKIY